MEMTVVSTAMPTAVGDLGGINHYAWIFTAYLLTATVTMPIYGKLADIYGRKPVMLIGISLFLLGSFLCGHADSMTMLVFFRAIQGLGAGAVQPIALTIVGDMFDVHQRAKIQGLLSAVWGVAGLAGPVLGGAIVHLLSWRWVFYINIPLGIGCALVLFFAYHETVRRRKHQLDATGAILLSMTIVFALLGTKIRGEGIYFFPAAAATLAAFIWFERRAADPLIPLELFRKRVIAVASAGGALMGAAMMSATTFIPLYVQIVLAKTPYEAGSAIAPIAIGWPISSTLAGRLLPRLGYRFLIRLGQAVTLLAAIGLSILLSPDANLWVVRLTMFVYGLGLGLANPPLMIAVQSNVSWDQRGVATAVTMFSRTIGGTLAVGMLGSVLTATLAARDIPSDIADKVLGAERMTIPPLMAESTINALQDGMGMIFHVVAAIALAGFLVSLLFPRIQIAPIRSNETRPSDTTPDG